MIRRAAFAAVLALAVGAGAARAQDVESAIHNPVRFTGDVVSMGQVYGHTGIAGRWPDESFSIGFTPQLTLFNDVTMGLDLLLSTQGSSAQQSINQLGFNPSWRWITLHAGDFSDDYGDLTVQGTRVRGAGFDLTPGLFRISFQGGQSQRAVFAGDGTSVYARNLFAGMVGFGRPDGSYVDVTVLKAKDDPNSVQQALVDTTLIDTIPVALRPQEQTRPQENLVMGVGGQLTLLNRRLVLKGEGDGAVVTHDLDSPLANPDAVRFGSLVSGLMPLRLSSSGDYAYKLDGTYAFPAGAVRAGYQYVGPGYTSLGLSYLINDRRAFTLGGNVGLLENRVLLQGQLQHQNDNLLGQKVATTSQDAVMLSAALRPTENLSASVTAMGTAVVNDASVDTFAVNDHSYALTTSLALQESLLGKPAIYSLAYGIQRTHDVSVVAPVPRVTVHNLSASVQVNLSRAISVAPSLSLAATQTVRAATQENLFFGFRGTGRFLQGRLTASFDASETFTNSRGVTGVNSQLAYVLPWASRLLFQTRYNHYAALGGEPAFTESFATLTVSRSF